MPSFFRGTDWFIGWGTYFFALRVKIFPCCLILLRVYKKEKLKLYFIQHTDINLVGTTNLSYINNKKQIKANIFNHYKVRHKKKLQLGLFGKIYLILKFFFYSNGKTLLGLKNRFKHWIRYFVLRLARYNTLVFGKLSFKISGHFIVYQTAELVEPLRGDAKKIES